MSNKLQSSSVLDDSSQILNVWTANPDFTLGEVTVDTFRAAHDSLQAADQAVDAKRTELTGLINDRDQKAATLNDLVTRARSGFRAVYGPDSTQYEQAGGTRASERKKPSRKTSEIRKAA